MSFDGTEGETISLTTASGFTENYRDEAGTGATLGHFIGRDLIEDILDQTGCMGIRMYYGIDGDGNKVLILVGANGDEDDMLDIIVDRTVSCPPRCGSTNALNS